MGKLRYGSSSSVSAVHTPQTPGSVSAADASMSPRVA